MLTLHLNETTDQNFLYQDGVSIDGSDGYDTLFIQGNEPIDFGGINNITNIEALNLGTGSDNGKVVTLDLSDVLDLTDASDILHIEGDAFDTIDLSETDGNWEHVASDESGYEKYTGTYNSETITLEIDNSINIIEH